ncbi:carph-isopro domain-containing protein [Azospirillum formosense]|uniref:carph-isopro domain-containing protein n=1 Tax=Azospirillum formosense TaxID=861533 RepID=UPI0033906458
MNTQADRIIGRFGTQTALADAIGVRQSAVAAWKRRGIIPARQQLRILEVARERGIPLEPADFFEDGAGSPLQPPRGSSVTAHAAE